MEKIMDDILLFMIYYIIQLNNHHIHLFHLYLLVKLQNNSNFYILELMILPIYSDYINNNFIK